MIIGVEKDSKDVLSLSDIVYTHINGYMYDIPFIIELGAMEHLINSDILIVGEKYKLITRYNQSLELVLSEVNPHPKTIQGQVSTAYIFMHEESYNLKYNLYPPAQSVWGVKLEKYIIGGKNQLQIAIFELRKKGLTLGFDKDFNIIQRHAKEFSSDEDMYISHQSSAKKTQTLPMRKNYASIEPNGGVGQHADTKRGGGRPYYIPNITKNEINGLNMLVEPQIIVQSDSENIDILLGIGVNFKDKKYCAMERNTIYIKSNLKTIITLGEIPNE